MTLREPKMSETRTICSPRGTSVTLQVRTIRNGREVPQ
jgi:hypothetical protein